MIESTPLPDIGSLLSLASDGKLRSVHRFIQTIPNEEVRRSLQGALRPWLRTARPARLFTPLRFFCLPFETLLCDHPPKIWQMGRIPRPALVPLWRMIQSHAADPSLLTDEASGQMLPARLDAEWARHPLFDAALEALAAIRQRSLKDERFRAKGLEICHGFWDVVAVIDDILRMRMDYVEALPHVQSLPEGTLDLEQAQPVLTIVRRAAGGSRQRLVLLMLLLAKTDDLAPRVLEMNRRIGGSTGSAIFNEIARILVEDLREAVERLDKRSAEQDLPDLVRDFDHLGTRITQLREVSLGRRDIHDLYAAFKVLLRQRFEETADRIVRDAQHCLESGSPFPERFARALDALSRGRPLFVHNGLKSVYRRKAAEIMTVVQDALGNLARASTGQSSQVRNMALDTVIDSTHALEPLLGTNGAIAVLRQNFAHLSGETASTETDKFLVQLVEMKIREEEAAERVNGSRR